MIKTIQSNSLEDLFTRVSFYKKVLNKWEIRHPEYTSNIDILGNNEKGKFSFTVNVTKK